MKTTRLLIMLATAATLMFAACDKDKDEDKNTNKNSESSGGAQLNIADNTLEYDGATYTFSEVVVDRYHSALTLMSAITSETTTGGEPLVVVDGIHITPNAWNRDFDLANQSQWPDEVSVYIILDGLDISFEGWVNGDRDISGHLDGVEYEHSSIFTSGTYRVSGNNDGTPITVTVNGTLKNGKTLQMKIVSGNYE